MFRIKHIDDLLPAIKGHPEFVVGEREGYVFIDYLYVTEDTFADPRRLECRGIKFSPEGEIIARPLRKFFNLGERGTTLPIEEPHTIMEKFDGSMIHPAFVNGSLVLMTRKGCTDVAKQAEERFLHRPAYMRFMLDCYDNGLTPTFEFTAPDNRIVLPYEESKLTLLALRAIVGGQTMPNAAMSAMVKTYGIPYAGRAYVINNSDGLPAFLEHTRALEGAEGYVVHFDSGYMVKIKAEDYVLKHRALDDMGSKKKVLALILQGFADDVKPILDPYDKAELEKFEGRVNVEIDIAVQFLLASKYDFVETAVDRKAFAINVVPAAKAVFGDWIAGCMFGTLDGKDPREQVCAAMRKDPDIVKTLWRGK